MSKPLWKGKPEAHVEKAKALFVEMRDGYVNQVLYCKERIEDCEHQLRRLGWFGPSDLGERGDPFVLDLEALTRGDR